MAQLPSRSRTVFMNLAFVAVCGGIFLFLYNAPPETTAKLPFDDDHARFYPMDKKAAERECEACHRPDGSAPLPPDHPPKYRCLFCHKKLPAAEQRQP
ncbi:MAG: hypothetical protein AB1634_01475 [Thermodesulfobacteriota bacterium]